MTLQSPWHDILGGCKSSYNLLLLKPVFPVFPLVVGEDDVLVGAAEIHYHELWRVVMSASRIIVL